MNILWITADHQQWQTIAGRSACKTPNLQRLVDEGMLFERAYTPAPVCCPVRAMWATGAWPWHNGVYTQVHSSPSLTRDMKPDAVSYAHQLRDAGFRTGFVGKWHASHFRSPLEFGYDELAQASCVPKESLLGRETTPDVPLPDGLPEQTYTSTRKFSWPGSEPFDMWGHYEGPIERHPITRRGDSAVEMLRRFAGKDGPWHIAVHFPEPHDPYNPHRKFLDMYDPKELPVPESFEDTFENKPGMHRRESESWGAFTKEDVQNGMAHFFAYCTQIDDQIGRILDVLDETGQADDTMVAFTSDHGDMLGAHRMWIKSWMPYEEVWRMPLVARLPGVIPSGSVCEHLVQTHDLPHTFLALSGAEALPFQDGRSLAPLFEDPSRDDWEDVIMGVGYGCEFFVTQRLLWTQRYKYVFNGFDYDEMYDLVADPNEMRNLIRDESLAGVRGELRGKLYEMMNRHGDPYGDADNPAVPGSCPNRYGAPRYLPRN